MRVGKVASVFCVGGQLRTLCNVSPHVFERTPERAHVVLNIIPGVEYFAGVAATQALFTQPFDMAALQYKGNRLFRHAPILTEGCRIVNKVSNVIDIINLIGYNPYIEQHKPPPGRDWLGGGKITGDDMSTNSSQHYSAEATKLYNQASELVDIAQNATRTNYDLFMSEADEFNKAAQIIGWVAHDRYNSEQEALARERLTASEDCQCGLGGRVDGCVLCAPVAERVYGSNGMEF